MKTILDNVRQLKPNEMVRKGDWYREKGASLYNRMIKDGTNNAVFWSNYEFFRRIHKAKPTTTYKECDCDFCKRFYKECKEEMKKKTSEVKKQTCICGDPGCNKPEQFKQFKDNLSKIAATKSKTSGVNKPKVLVVSFEYPHSNDFTWMPRNVQVIEMNERYLIGLEITNVWNDETRDYLPHYQFKKFLRSKIRYNSVELVSYE